MKNMTTLEDLKKKAFAIPSPIEVVYPPKFKDIFDPAKENYRNNTFNTHNREVIAFFTENILYVIPFTYKAAKILEDANFVWVIEDDGMYIPFCECDYPAAESEKWLTLKKEASDQRAKEFEYEVIEYSNLCQIGSIDDSLLEKCFEIPEEGLVVKYSDSTANISPVYHKNWAHFVKQLGHYNYNKGTYVFVYRNGKTYVTRCYDVVLALKKANYQPNFDMYVPLSNGERIMQTKYAKQWEKVKVM